MTSPFTCDELLKAALEARLIEQTQSEVLIWSTPYSGNEVDLDPTSEDMQLLERFAAICIFCAVILVVKATKS